MPLITGLIVSSVTYVYGTGGCDVHGEYFAENQYDGKIEVTKDGGATYIEFNSYGGWANTHVSGTFSPLLVSGVWDLRITNGDNETYSFSGAIKVGGLLTTVMYGVEDGEANAN